MNGKTINVERKKLERLLEQFEESYHIEFENAANEIRAILNPVPKMTIEDWQRVIDEEFYVRRGEITKLLRVTHPYKKDYLMFYYDSGSSDMPPEIIREFGLRQPHFKGHPHPEGAGGVVCRYSNGEKTSVGSACTAGWDNVSEYIVIA